MTQHEREDIIYSYAESGVNVDVEEQAAGILYAAARATWRNRDGRFGQVETLFDDFSGGRITRVANLPIGTVMQSCADGVGSKADIARLANNFITLGYDLLAMTADDAAIRGGEPVNGTDTLIVNTLGNTDERLGYIHEIAQGLVAAAEEADVAILNGEIAQHIKLAPKEVFAVDWNASINWFGHESRVFKGTEVQPGDVLIGLREDGFRANGITLLQVILTGAYGEQWQNQMFGDKRLGDVALHPSRIYAKAIVDMTGGLDLDRQPKATLHGAAHITGSGIPGKLGRVLKPSGMGAIIDVPYSPPDLMRHAQAIGNVSDREAYRTWHMGQGMILISPSPEDVLKVAEAHGIAARVIGKITKEPGITIHSQGVNGELLKF